MNITTVTADVLVVGGGTGGTAVAIQAAQRGAIPPIWELMRGNRRAGHAEFT
ncbi:hypothetical protein [Halomicronema hongdechloris]|uniref:hypothetical protein n=1 Tax=Halomicronema hongdechloris TaxID=1209493 RepID=UPI0016517005|nr:hypothetical protein [Halomicronema hongdechloris]